MLHALRPGEIIRGRNDGRDSIRSEAVAQESLYDGALGPGADTADGRMARIDLARLFEEIESGLGLAVLRVLAGLLQLDLDDLGGLSR